MDIHLSEINFENIGSWPNKVKIAVIIMIFVVLLFLGYWFNISGQLTKLNKAQARELALKTSFVKKQQLAVNLYAYRQQLKQIKDSFHQLLQQLPTQSEIPGLLEDISRTGRAAGLSFRLFKPSPEVQQDFYAVLPIKISVVGNYHQLAEFISDVANLDRIVTLHDFSIAYVAKKKTTSGENLVLDILAKTYRYTADADNNVRDTVKQGKRKK